MVNYQNGKIYKLVSFRTDKVYIGSTCEKLSVRKAKHKRSYNQFLSGKYHNVTSFELIKLGDVDIVLLEEYPCENKEQLHKRERFYIENTNNCVNKKMPIQTRKEYREKNKEIIKQHKKEYYEEHKEEIELKANQVFRCSCGIDVRKKNKARHEKTLKHLNYLQALTDNIQLEERQLVKCSCGHYVSVKKKIQKAHEKTQKHLNSLK
jgi:hypothetical protein